MATNCAQQVPPPTHQVMPFAKRKMDEAGLGGAVVLDPVLPFDEAALLEENRDFLMRWGDWWVGGVWGCGNGDLKGGSVHGCVQGDVRKVLSG